MLTEEIMPAAPILTIAAEPAFGLVFLVVWSVLMGGYLHFLLRVGPAALRHWANAEGYQIVTRKAAGLFDRLAVAKGSGHHVYRVVVRDREGREHQGLVRVGQPYWICTSPNRCPVSAFWGAGVDPVAAVNAATDALSAKLAGSGLFRAVTTRRLVLGFAIADLALACLVLAFEVMVLVALALGIERLRDNRPSPDTRQDDLLATAGCLGMFVLYLPALATLVAGGVGLLRRRRWGYYCHLAGAVCFAVSIFGLVIPSPRWCSRSGRSSRRTASENPGPARRD
jgi:hypothetical protein